MSIKVIMITLVIELILGAVWFGNDM